MLDQSQRERLSDRWRRFRERKEARALFAIVQRLMFVGVVAYLVYKLTQVGWSNVAGNLPAAPLFYILFLLRYLALPLSEIPAYQMVWRKPLWRHVTAFIRKRVYNSAVMGYSGEAVFTLWARRNLSLRDNEILAGVKDNNILSAFASNAATVIVIGILAMTGDLQTALSALPGALILFSLALASSIILVGVVILFRRRILHVSDALTVRLTAIHSLRMVIVLALHAAMYSVALPDGALTAWLIFIAVQLVLSRIPFLPNQDLVYLGAALAISGVAGVPEAAIAGMLVAEAGLSQGLNFILFFATAKDATSRLEEASLSDDK